MLLGPKIGLASGQNDIFLLNMCVFSLFHLKLHGYAYFYYRKISCIAPL